MKLLGVVFPGQGSQSVGMLNDIASHFPEVEAIFEEASTVLGYDLWKLAQEGPSEELDLTIHTQPALLTASYALWRILEKKKNWFPHFLAGHSLGEYTALVCAKAISFKDAVKLVAARAHYMQDAVPLGEGALAVVVGLEDKTVNEICHAEVAENEILSPANFNCPGQVVVAGHIHSIKQALVSAKNAGAKLAKLLPVSVPSHCALMKPAAERLNKLLKTITINKPTLSVLSNVDVTIYQTPEQIREGLVKQLFMPVRWVEIIQAFTLHGVNEIVECGPGKVLTGLNKRISPNLNFKITTDFLNLETLLMNEEN